VIEQLQVLVSADPVEYVREAARAQLVAGGQTPRESIVPVQLKQEGAGIPALFAIGCIAFPVVLSIVAIVCIAVLAILGPQIGNVFSRVTNGLAGPQKILQAVLHPRPRFICLTHVKVLDFRARKRLANFRHPRLPFLIANELEFFNFAAELRVKLNVVPQRLCVPSPKILHLDEEM